MPLAMKSVLVLEERERAAVAGRRYVWSSMGAGLIWLICKALLGFRGTGQLDQVFREQFGFVEYVYRNGSVREHSIQPSGKALLRASAWGKSLLVAIVGTAIYLSWRLAMIYFWYGGPDDPAAGVLNDLGVQMTLEGVLAGLMLFVLSLGLNLWLSVRRDLTEQVIAERGDVTDGAVVKYVHLTDWPKFESMSTAR